MVRFNEEAEWADQAKQMIRDQFDPEEVAESMLASMIGALNAVSDDLHWEIDVHPPRSGGMNPVTVDMTEYIEWLFDDCAKIVHEKLDAEIDDVCRTVRD